jgi:hypothetical protein
MSEKKMKSALDLAMERLDAESGAAQPVSAEQKAEMADIDTKAKSKIAEMEIMHQQNLLKARGNYAKIMELEAAMKAGAKKVRDGAEEDKQAVRDNG